MIVNELESVGVLKNQMLGLTILTICFSFKPGNTN